MSASTVMRDILRSDLSITNKVADRIVAQVREQGIELPAIIIQADEQGPLERAVPQLDSGYREAAIVLQVVATSLDEAEAVADAVQTFIHGFQTVHGVGGSHPTGFRASTQWLGSDQEPADPQDGDARGWPTIAIDVALQFEEY